MATDTNPVEVPGSLAAALAVIQASLPTIKKARTGQAGNRSTRYADLADVTAAVMPMLGPVGLAWLAKPTLNDKREFVLHYKLMHTSGDVEDGEYPLGTGTQQQLGSAITYARRYSFCSVLGIAPEGDDDDAAEAEQRSPDPSEPHPALIGAFVDEVYNTTNVPALRAIGKRVAQRQLMDLETVDYVGNPTTLRKLLRDRADQIIAEEKEGAGDGA